MRKISILGAAVLSFGLTGPVFAATTHHRIYHARHSVVQSDQSGRYSATAPTTDYPQSDRVAPVAGPKMTNDGFLPAQNDNYLSRHSMGTMGSSGY